MGRGKGGRDGDDDPEGDALWDYVTRSVTPLPDREKPRKAIKNTKKPRVRAKEQVLPPVRAEVQGNRELDRRTAERFRKGQIKLEAVIDLHGMNQQQAYERLRGFIASSYSAGRRMLLVITGKGGKGADGPRRGVLRQRVPEWLEEKPLRDIVLQVTPAQGRDGGDGALYVYLRRKRTDD